MFKRDALKRKYDKTGLGVILDKLLEQALLVEKRNERAWCVFMHGKISDALGHNKYFWKEMRKLGLFPTLDNALHGFSPDELDNHFSSILVSPLEDLIESFNITSKSRADEFLFRPVTASDVILAVAHFKSLARGENSIPHSIVMCHFHVKFFPRHGKKTVLLPSKRYPLPPPYRNFIQLLFFAFFLRFLRSYLMIK